MHWHPPNPVNPAINSAGAGLGRISEKWPDSVFAGAGIQQYGTLFFITDWRRTASHAQISDSISIMGRLFSIH